MNHSLSCTVFNRGNQISKSSWNLGETDLDRFNFLGDLDVGSDAYEIKDPVFVWINTNSPVDLAIEFTDSAEKYQLDGIMLYSNSFDRKCTIKVTPRDSSTSQLVSINMHSITIAKNASKIPL